MARLGKSSHRGDSSAPVTAGPALPVPGGTTELPLLDPRTSEHDRAPSALRRAMLVNPIPTTQQPIHPNAYGFDSWITNGFGVATFSPSRESPPVVWSIA